MIVKKIMDQNKSEQIKIKVDCFVPLSSCMCVYSHFLDRVTNLITPFMSKIEFNVKNTNSPEADQLDLIQMAVVIWNYPNSAKPIVITDLNQIPNYLSKI